MIGAPSTFQRAIATVGARRMYVVGDDWELVGVRANTTGLASWEVTAG